MRLQGRSRVPKNLADATASTRQETIARAASLKRLVRELEPHSDCDESDPDCNSWQERRGRAGDQCDHADQRDDYRDGSPSLCMNARR
jgi:hypothetical protein